MSLHLLLNLIQGGSFHTIVGCCYHLMILYKVWFWISLHIQSRILFWKHGHRCKYCFLQNLGRIVFKGGQEDFILLMIIFWNEGLIGFSDTIIIFCIFLQNCLWLFSMSQTNDSIGSYSSSLSKCFFRYSMNPLLMDSIGSYCMMPTRRFISHVTNFSLDISPHRFITSSLTKFNGSDFFSIIYFFTADLVCI